MINHTGTNHDSDPLGLAEEGGTPRNLQWINEYMKAPHVIVLHTLLSVVFVLKTPFSGHTSVTIVLDTPPPHPKGNGAIYNDDVIADTHKRGISNNVMQLE